MTEDLIPSSIEDEQNETEEDDDLYAVVPTGRATEGEEDRDIPAHQIDFIYDVPLTLSVEIGQSTMSVREILALTVGKYVEFTKVVGEPMDITISGRLIARGEIVVVNERYGVRISEVTRPDETSSSPGDDA